MAEENQRRDDGGADVDDAPENGQGFESAVAYAIADQLGYPKDKVAWTRAPAFSADMATIAPAPAPRSPARRDSHSAARQPKHPASLRPSPARSARRAPEGVGHEPRLEGEQPSRRREQRIRAVLHVVFAAAIHVAHRDHLDFR